LVFLFLELQEEITMQENLFEMVNDSNEEIPGAVIEEAQAGMEDNILTFDKPEPENVPPIKKEVINESTQMVPYENQSRNIADDFHAETEEDLINHTRNLYKETVAGVVITYWKIGYSINAFYEKKYGSGELQRIADQTGVSLDSLHKACKFANRFSREHIEELLNGPFAISWYQIANNLTVEPDNLVATYKESDSPKTFHNAIMYFKKSNARNNRPARDRDEENQTPDSVTLEGSSETNEDSDRADNVESNIAGSQYPDEREPEPMHTADIEDAEEIPPFDNSEEIEVLNDMLEDAKTEIQEKDKLIGVQNIQIEEMKKTIEDKDWILSSIKLEVERIKMELEGATLSDALQEAIDQMHTLLAE